MFGSKEREQDIFYCSKCNIEEDIHLLDGLLDENGNDTGQILCIACYPKANWCPTGIEHIAISVAPSLKPLYDAWLERWSNKIVKAETR